MSPLFIKIDQHCWSVDRFKMQDKEDLDSVSFPGRGDEVLQFFKEEEGKATVSFLDPDDKPASGFGVSGDHSPRSSELYGIVASITAVAATFIFLDSSFSASFLIATSGPMALFQLLLFCVEKIRR